MIGLDPTYSKQHGGLVIHGVSEKIFQLAQLISAHGKRGQIVALDIEFYAQVLGYTRKIFDRRGQMKEIFFFMV